MQKIDSLKPKSSEIVIASFIIRNKQKRFSLFMKSYLFANISINITLEIFYFIFNHIKIDFINSYLYWKTFIIIKALLITKQSDLIWEKIFVIAVFNHNNKAFISHITFINQKLDIYLFYIMQIAILKI